MNLPERLRLATALAHSAGGITLILRRSDGASITVADHRLDAGLSPCALRRALCGHHHRPTAAVGALVDVEVSSGLVDLGAGCYQRGHRGIDDERWLATFVDAPRVKELFEQCPLTFDGPAPTVTLRPDPALGVTVVRLGSEPHPDTRGAVAPADLDELARWAATTVLVEELVHAVTAEVDR